MNKKSKYAQKQAAKNGSGSVDPRWMSWRESEYAPPRRIGPRRVYKS